MFRCFKKLLYIITVEINVTVTCDLDFRSYCLDLKTLSSARSQCLLSMQEIEHHVTTRMHLLMYLLPILHVVVF